MPAVIHYTLHLIFPAFLAWIFFSAEWKKAYLIMLLTMLVDLDHLFATPIFDAHRCSIGFHPLHSYIAIACYLVMLAFPKPYRIIAVGLIFHMFTDYLDCIFMSLS